MFKHFFPDEYHDGIGDIDYAKLYDKGIRGLIFDIDNTIEGYGLEEPSDAKKKLLESLRGMGFSLCLASNNSESRVTRFNRALRLPALHRSGKPSPGVVLRAAALMGVEAGKTAVIGDQLFTDIWMGRRAGCYAILVRPATGWDPWNVALKRIPEKWVIKKYLKKR